MSDTVNSEDSTQAKSGLTDEHIKTMTDKVDSGTAKRFDMSLNEVLDTEATTDTNSDKSLEIKLLAGKYKTEEDLERGVLELLKKKGSLESYYKELESDYGKAGKTSEITPDTKQNTNSDEAKTSEVKADLWSTVNTEYTSGSELSGDTLSKLKELGIPDSIIETHMKGLEALRKQQETEFEASANSIYDAAGGEASYKQLTEWAVNSLPEKTINDFNSTINSGNLEAIRLQVLGLRTLYERDNGVSPQKLISGSTSNASSDVFTTQKEVSQAMSDKRYGKDKDYTKQIQAKLHRSHI